MSDVWTRWEGHVVGEAYPLRRYLGGSDHSGVFLTEFAPQNSPNAALKLVPVIPTLAESQLAHWRTAKAAAHPHLIRILDTGRCQLGEQHFLYVVMEYAEQNLGQLLRHRAMTEAEAREMLLASLDALAFLHSLNLVQGQFKPSNVLVVDDQLKLSSDTIRPAGEANASISMSSPYDPPEARDGSFAAAGDIWALGITTFEALTQKREGSGAEFPPNFPPTLAEIVRRCLNPSPAARPRAREVEGWLKSGLPTMAKVTQGGMAAPQPVRSAAAAAPNRRPAAGSADGGPTARSDAPTRLVVRAALLPGAQSGKTPRQESRRASMPMIIGAAAIVAVVWFGFRAFKGHESSNTAPTAAVPHTTVSSVEQSAPPAQSASAAGSPTGHASALNGSRSAIPTARVSDASTVKVVHEEIPVASRGARATIRGHIKVSVRVTIDAAGNVIGESLTDPGPSRYFAHLATQAARKWRFAPDSATRREQVLRFEFSREGATGRVVK